MEHTEALEKMMAERYLLGELLEEDRDAFEDHFFDCPECAAAVRDGAVLLDSGRRLIRDVPIPLPQPRYRQWAAAAAVIIATSGWLGAGYERLVTIPAQAAQIQSLRAPRITELWGLR